jgi:RNA polymerase sigma-70 factor (ECF subfamily)
MEAARTIDGFAETDEKQCARTGEERFQELYEATSRPLWAYLFHVLGRADAADDVVQDTYCRFLERKTPEMDAAATKSYLFRIATNLVRDRYRSGAGTLDQLDEMDEAHREAPASVTGPGMEAQLDVLAAMGQMKPRERELLWLAYVEGMSHAEIASTTGLGKMSIRLLLFRARRRAAQLLRPERTEL